MDDFLSVSNLQHYQHYKHRNPPWIKVYREFWTDHTLLQLTLPERMLFLGCCSLAAEMGNKIPNDPSYLSKRLNIKVTSGMLSSLLSSSLLCLYSTLKHTFSAERLQDASTTLAPRKQVASKMLAERQPKDFTPIGIEVQAVADKWFPPMP